MHLSFGASKFDRTFKKSIDPTLDESSGQLPISSPKLLNNIESLSHRDSWPSWCLNYGYILLILFQLSLITIGIALWMWDDKKCVEQIEQFHDKAVSSSFSVRILSSLKNMTATILFTVNGTTKVLNLPVKIIQRTVVLPVEISNPLYKCRVNLDNIYFLNASYNSISINFDFILNEYSNVEFVDIEITIPSQVIFLQTTQYQSVFIGKSVLRYSLYEYTPQMLKTCRILRLIHFHQSNYIFGTTENTCPPSFFTSSKNLLLKTSLKQSIDFFLLNDPFLVQQSLLSTSSLFSNKKIISGVVYERIAGILLIIFGIILLVLVSAFGVYILQRRQRRRHQHMNVIITASHPVISSKKREILKEKEVLKVKEEINFIEGDEREQFAVTTKNNLWSPLCITKYEQKEENEVIDLVKNKHHEMQIIREINDNHST